MTHHRWMRLAALSLVLLAGMGCSRVERSAREHLEIQGMSEVELETVGDGVFRYTSIRGITECVGSLDISQRGGSTSIIDHASCTPRDEQCDADSPEVCWWLGKIHEEGDGDQLDPTPIDTRKAASYFQRGCDFGHASSCNALGLAFASGRGVTKDQGKANSLFDKACCDGAMRGCYNLALTHHHGRGRPEDPGKAQPLYQRACDGDLSSACYNLGVCARDGVGREKEHGLARSSFLKACRANHMDACLNLGVLLTLAERLPAEPKLARRAFEHACRGGVEDACYALTKLEVVHGG